MRICGAILAIVLTLFTMGCASVVPVTKYCPEPQQNVFTFFTDGQPIAAIQTEDAFLLLALEPAMAGNSPYMRLWMLYQNMSNSPYLLEPLKFATLATTRISKDESISCVAESPTRILKHISDEKAALMIIQAIGGTLQAVAVQSNAVAMDSVSRQTAAAITNTAIWYDIYKNSINKGILRKNTVFPRQSVNGYIYFPFPNKLTDRIADQSIYGEATSYDMTYDNYIRSMDYMHVIKIATSEESKNIKFMPIEGE